MSAEYRLCAEERAAELNTEVNKLLNEGWELYGNPFSATPGDGVGENKRKLLCQALTKRKLNKAGIRSA